jgi:hypothetical protein
MHRASMRTVCAILAVASTFALLAGIRGLAAAPPALPVATLLPVEVSGSAPSVAASEVLATTQKGRPL